MAVENLEVRSCNDGVFSSEMYGLKWKGKSVRNITTINQIGSAGSTLHDKMYEFFFNLGVLSPESQENM
jgi:hypothetical protein